MPLLVSDSAAACWGTPAGRPPDTLRSLGECVTQLTEILLASHPHAASLRTRLDDLRVRVSVDRPMGTTY